MVGSAPNDRLRLSVYASKGELSFNIPQMLHDSHSHYLKLCERTLTFAVFPAGRGSGGARGGSRLTDLAQPQVFNYAEKCQQLNFLRFSVVSAMCVGDPDRSPIGIQSLKRSPNS